MLQAQAQAPTDALYIARQPILSANGAVFGYELLYRAAETDTTCTAPGDPAAASVLSDALLALGLERLTEGKPAFLNVTRALLLSGACTLLNKKAAIFEIREDVEVDDEVIAACRDLRAKGYQLALDDYIPRTPADQLLPFVQFVKVDVLATSARQRTVLARWLRRKGIRLIAEKVETQQVLKQTKTAGYELFQGYFFCQPTTLSAKALPARQLAYMQLLSAVNQPNLTMGQLEDLIKHDVSLTVRILRCVNSAAFGVHREIRSLREALVMLGTKTISKWATVWSMAGINSGPGEVASLAILRARCCEIMGERLTHGNGADMFLLGLCSLLEAMTAVPMMVALEDLPLSAETRQALLGSPGTERSLLDAVIAYERGEWDEAERITDLLGLPAALLPAAYGESLRWAADLSRM